MDAFFKTVLDGLTAGVNWLDKVVWGWPMILLILGTGILLTARTRFLQVRHFRDSVNSTIKPALQSFGKGGASEQKTDRKNVSPFESFATAISGTVGTGNIIGVTSAILTGGPGAVFWMWISAFFGMITNYAENVLGLYFRKKNRDGSYSGGAFYYLTYGLHCRPLGMAAAIFCLVAAVGMSGVQTNKITGTIAPVLGIDSSLGRLLIGGAVALLTAVIILGGIRRIGRFASYMVPFMSLLFVVLAVFGILMNFSSLPAAIELIFSSAFSFRAMSGGFGGYVFGQIIKKGMARGVFSNEAGLGSSVIAHAASDTKEPVQQGLWGIFEVFFDTFVICTLTALLVLTTYLRNGQLATFSAAASDAAVSLGAFTANFGAVGTVCFLIILPLFAFTTILAWSYYGEKAADFLFGTIGPRAGKAAAAVFKVVYLLMIVVAALIESRLVWAIDDVANGLMALPNLIGVVALSGLVVKITRNYFDRRHGETVEPMLSAYSEQNEAMKNELAESDYESCD